MRDATLGAARSTRSDVDKTSGGTGDGVECGPELPRPAHNFSAMQVSHESTYRDGTCRRGTVRRDMFTPSAE